VNAGHEAWIQGSPTTSFEVLAEARYVLLTTFRRNGTAVPTPVCSAVADGVIYSSTASGAGKVKRIRHTPQVTVAACDVRGRVTGPTYRANAELLSGTAADYATRLKEARNRLAWLRRILETKFRGRHFIGLAIHPGTVGPASPSSHDALVS
jgi:PPOX class probable F420-dependent enzyme